MTVVIDRATAGDIPAVRTLLAGHRLPLDDVDRNVRTTLVARDGRQVVGSAALEIYDGGALLRSVAVDSRMQSSGIGHQLIDATLQLAREAGADQVFLLTTAAEQFFPRFGFEHIARSDVPASVQTSVEFQSACPASAVVMRKRLER